MSEPLRKIPYGADVVLSEAIETAVRQMDRKERYQLEKSKAKGELELTPDIQAMFPSKHDDFNSRLLFWDVLRAVSREAALYLVLRHCLGYSVPEIAAGLSENFNRVRWYTESAKRAAQSSRE